MHIGLIGGIGPAATEFYYRGLIHYSASEGSALELTIAHANMQVLLRNMAAEARDVQADIFRTLVEQLAGAGADVAAVTSIAGHFCFRELLDVSPLPLVNALSAVRESLDRRGITRLGILGSQMAMASDLYGTLSDLQVVLPDDVGLIEVGEAYLAMAAAQEATSAQRELFFRVGAGLCSDQGAEVVLLAGTDMFLAFTGSEPGFDVMDSAQAHIDAISQFAAS